MRLREFAESTDQDDEDKLFSPYDDTEPKKEPKKEPIYVRDNWGDDEVFIVQGNLTDYKIRIVDRHGRGWTVSPHRVTIVTDPEAINEYFGPKNNQDDDWYDDQEGDY